MFDHAVRRTGLMLFFLLCSPSWALQSIDDKGLENISGKNSMLVATPPPSSKKHSALHDSVQQSQDQVAVTANTDTQNLHVASNLSGSVQASGNAANPAAAASFLRGVAGQPGGSAPQSSGGDSSQTTFVPIGAILNQAGNLMGTNNSSNPLGNMTMSGVHGGSNVSVNMH